ncbi:hydroxyacid dehydrogenase [Jiangella mangrovi]|uniref:Phosphoglycerate dehydrogenase-like enzyme n=1 Tax=Jiangella mangrovi TaxID=1524084 RepID=A0A7W9GVN6_9ACTN|nr:hydroxyacid dehydrogenase [Jiangella mangrovi]MBB5790792.1 phosphoglycerate dehydrogenase-like enzyme [Jiangella mangrovi]
MADERVRVVLAMTDTAYRDLFDAELRSRLEALADLVLPGPVASFDPPEVRAALGSTDVLLTSWGCPPLEAAVLDAAPRLRAVLHAAGSVKHHVTDACWDRDLAVTTAADANAVPVAEFTLAAILAAGKRAHAFAAGFRTHPGELAWRHDITGVSNYRRTVGVVGFSRIGRRVVDLLRPFDLTVLVADPYANPAAVTAAGAEPAGLDDLLTRSDTVTLHAPALPETHHLIDARSCALMNDGATLINTARGALVDHAALSAECETGRLHAVLDVTDPEPLPPDSPLYRLPNVVLTPHIAGAMGTECHRLTTLALDELERLVRGEPLQHRVHRTELVVQA